MIFYHIIELKFEIIEKRIRYYFYIINEHFNENEN